LNFLLIKEKPFDEETASGFPKINKKIKKLSSTSVFKIDNN